MKLNRFLLPLICVLTLQACQRDNQQAQGNNAQAPAQHETPTKMLEYLVGEWQIDSAQNATQQGQQNQRMIFTNEARYIQYSGNQKVDSGAYRMNEQLNNLYLESEANEEPREYEIQFEENTMTLRPNQPGDQQGNQTMTFRRISSQTGHSSPLN